MIKLNLLIVFIIVVVVSGSAQSLNRDNPYPLKAGTNKSIVDSYVGTQYWYFYALPGSNQVKVRLKNPTSVFGALQNIILTITLSDEKQTWRLNQTASSNRIKTVDGAFTANKIDKKIKVIISIAPPAGQIIRAGGQYEIEATGDVGFDELKNSNDPIVRTYNNSRYGGAVKFLANGTVEATDGSTGNWKVFDSENRLYTVVINGNRSSLRYQPGYGLADPADLFMLQFTEVAH